MKKELFKIIYIRSQCAESAPPLGTILGNIGVNTLKFCDEFNKFTKSLPKYFIVKVKIKINDNKTFNFSIYPISLSHAISLLKYKIVDKNSKEIYYIKLNDLVSLCVFKFRYKHIQESFNIIYGIARSMNLKIIR